MSLDPNEYDLNELRGVPDDSFTDGEGPTGGVRASESLRSSHYRELLQLQSSASPEALAKPYLESVPETYAGEVTAFEWLEFLASKGGFKHTLDALHYYRDVGWLSESAEDRLRDYLDGVDTAESEHTNPFDVGDHLLSLVYIAQLARL